MIISPESLEWRFAVNSVVTSPGKVTVSITATSGTGMSIALQNHVDWPAGQELADIEGFWTLLWGMAFERLGEQLIEDGARRQATGES